MRDYKELTINLETAKGILIRLEETEIALATVKDILVTNHDNISFFQHNITIKIGEVHIDSVSNKNTVVLEAIQEKLEDDISIYKNMLKMMNVNIDDETS